MINNIKYYKFHLSTYLDNIANTLSFDQRTNVHSSGTNLNGPVFVPADYISDELYDKCVEIENSLRTHKK